MSKHRPQFPCGFLSCSNDQITRWTGRIIAYHAGFDIYLLLIHNDNIVSYSVSLNKAHHTILDNDDMLFGPGKSGLKGMTRRLRPPEVDEKLYDL